MSQASLVLQVDDVGSVPITLEEHGAGQPFLLLHGGGGPQTVTGFAERFAAAKDVRVLAPTHPGFGGTARPGSLTSVRGLARTYVALLDHLQLDDVTVVGNSLGGWIAAEVGLLASPRVSGVVLVDAVGIEVPGHPVADFFSLTTDEVVALSYHDPSAASPPPQDLPPQLAKVVAGNRESLALYAGRAMADPTLRDRLAHLDLAALVLWGASDRIVDPDYGRAYAEAMPLARFQVLPDTGHLPQLETPDLLVDAIWDCDRTDFSDQRVPHLT